MKSKQILLANRDNYQALYAKEEAFLRYPADWIIRFHNMYLKNVVPKGARILDYGCGSANNAVFFIQQGYTVHGVDVAPAFTNLVRKNLELHGLDTGLVGNFELIEPDSARLEYPDDHFDFVYSNQVLYYLPDEERIKSTCSEMKRVLRPGGTVFFTMMGPKNYYVTHFLKQVHADQVYEIRIDDEQHRLYGVRELIYIVRDEQELCDLFDAFEPVTTGYFDQRMFDLHSNFHFIFVGKNAG